MGTYFSARGAYIFKWGTYQPVKGTYPPPTDHIPPRRAHIFRTTSHQTPSPQKLKTHKENFAQKGEVCSPVQSTEASFSSLELGDGFRKIRFTKIRPEYIAEPKLGIRQLPQQKIADPLLSTRPNQ